MKLVCNKSDWLEDWYVIECAQHDGRSWLEPHEGGLSFQCSERISNACVEGTLAEMKALATAIEARGRATFDRCAVRIDGDRAFFRSPRNSTRDGECSYSEALELAQQINAIEVTS